jgi:hypothetical protein
MSAGCRRPRKQRDARIAKPALQGVTLRAMINAMQPKSIFSLHAQIVTGHAKCLIWHRGLAHPWHPESHYEFDL